MDVPAATSVIDLWVVHDSSTVNAVDSDSAGKKVTLPTASHEAPHHNLGAPSWGLRDYVQQPPKYRSATY